MILWIVIGIGAWIAICVGTVALCRAAAWGDETVIVPERPRGHAAEPVTMRSARVRAPRGLARSPHMRR